MNDRDSKLSKWVIHLHRFACSLFLIACVDQTCMLAGPRGRWIEASIVAFFMVWIMAERKRN